MNRRPGPARAQGTGWRQRRAHEPLKARLMRAATGGRGTTGGRAEAAPPGPGEGPSSLRREAAPRLDPSPFQPHSATHISPVFTPSRFPPRGLAAASLDWPSSHLSSLCPFMPATLSSSCSFTIAGKPLGVHASSLTFHLQPPRKCICSCSSLPPFLSLSHFPTSLGEHLPATDGPQRDCDPAFLSLSRFFFFPSVTVLNLTSTL